MNDRIEQDHRAIKWLIRSMLGFQSISCARVTLGGIEMIHMMRKGWAQYVGTQPPSVIVQFHHLMA
jgi:putative transposase